MPIWRSGSVLAGLILWQVVGSLRPHVLAPPADVVRAAITASSNGELWRETSASLIDLLLGLAIAVGVGVPIGVLMASHARLRATANMYLYWLFALPEVALIPFYIVALGYGRQARLFVIVLFALPVITQRALLGAAEVPETLLEMGRTFELSQARIFRRIVLPWAFPSMATGIRLGFLRALIGVVAAGIFAQLFGLGGRIWLAEQNYETSTMYMYIATVALLGLVGNGLIGLLDRRANWWAIADERSQK